MDYVFWLYLATRLDAIRSAFSACIVLSLMALVVLGFVTLTEPRVTLLSWRTYRVLLFVLLGVGAVGSMLTPSKSDAVFIAGGVGVIEAARAVAGSEIAKTSVSIIEKWLKEQERELDEKASKKR